MKVALVFLGVLAVALAFPQQAEIVSYNSDNDGVGSYKFEYALSDQTHRDEQGQLKNAGSENEAIEVSGSYGHKTPEGKTVEVRYTADENGYRPSLSIS